MAMMTRLATLEAGDFGSAENERGVCGPMDALHSLGEQGQGGQQTSHELHAPRKQEPTEPAWRGVPL